jgi:uncharacterized membrane protein
MEINFAANVWAVGVPLGGTFFMWLMMRAAMYKDNNPTSRVLVAVVCVLIFLAGFSFFQLIGIG